MISQTTEYALRAAVILCSDTEKLWPTAEIAQLSKVPTDYLYKVLQQLTKARLVESTRGARGGYRLVKKPDEVSILEVVEAVDPLPRILSCPLGLKAHGTRLCSLHKRLDSAMEMVEKAFAASTLGELVRSDGSKTVSRPCEFPLKARTSDAS